MRYKDFESALCGGMVRTIKQVLAIAVALLLAGALVGCGPEGDSVSIDATVHVTVKGLEGSGLVLQNNLRDDLSIPYDGTFSFSKTVSTGSPYSVTIKTPPSNPSQVCGLVNEKWYASGIVELNPDISVYVRCVVPVGFTYVANYFSNTLSAFAVDGSGAMAAIPGSPFAAGKGPRSIAVDPAAGRLYVANQADGENSVSAYAVNATNGALRPLAGSPFAAGLNPASIAIHPSGKFVLVANSGSHNVSVYALNATTGGLQEISGSPFPAGLGPTSVGFDPGGKFTFVTNGVSNDVSVYAISVATGALEQVPGSPFPAGTRPQAFATDPTGQFAYVANYQSQDVSAYRIDGGTGSLTAISGSPFPSVGWPMSLVVAPSGKFAYVGHGAEGISVYAIDPGTGNLTPLGPSTTPASPALVLDPTGTYAYATHPTSDSNHEDAVAAYTVDLVTGALTHVDAWPNSWADERVGVGALAIVLMLK